MNSSVDVFYSNFLQLKNTFRMKDQTLEKMYLSARGPSENDDTPLFRFVLIGEDNGSSDNEILFTIRAHLSGQNGCSKFILLQEICPFWCESFLVQNQYSCNLCFSIQITVGHHFRLIDDIGKSRCLWC